MRITYSQQKILAILKKIHEQYVRFLIYKLTKNKLINILLRTIAMKDELSYKESLLSEHESPQVENSQIKKYMATRAVINGQSNIQALFFSWLFPFLSFGNKVGVTVESMPTLPANLKTQNEYNKMFNIWQTTSRSKRQGFTLGKVFLKTFKKEWIQLFILLVFVVSIYMLGPYLTATNIDYIQNDQGNTQRGITLFIITFSITLINKIFFEQLMYRFAQIGLNLSYSLTMMVYCKSLKYPTLSQKEFGQAQIINYSQVDAQRMTNMGYHCAAFLYGPLQIIVALALMYWYIGISFLSGLAVIILLFISSYYISKKTIHYNQEVLKAKDERMKVTQEMLDIIRYVKISAIQKFFFQKLDEKRKIQMNFYVKKGTFDVLTNCVFWLTCPLLLSATFLTYILLGYEMTSGVAFTTIMISSIIEYPIYSLPTAISQVVQMMSSIKRIEKYLLSKQINNEHIKFTTQEERTAIKIDRGDFYWQKETQNKKDKDQQVDKNKQNKRSQNKQKIVDKEDQTESEVSDQEDSTLPSSEQFRESAQVKKRKGKFVHALRDINLTIEKGKLIMIVGDIGCGKSSLLYAILNQMIHTKNTSILINGSIAYSSQKPWIMSGTVRDNIIFTMPYNQSKFKAAIHYASLQHDLQILPKGDETQIGQKGINISGGQKARISLARTLYSERDIYMLDDILSAVDVHVGQFILKETLKGLLKGKTVLMPTHAIKFAEEADEIIVMKKGRIVRKGHYSDIFQTPEFLQISEKQAQKQNKQHAHEQKDDEASIEAELAMLRDAMKIKSHSADQKQQQCITDRVIQELILPQDQQTGKVDFNIFKQYVKLNGGASRFIFLIILTMFLWTSFKTAASLIMQIWCENPIGNNLDLYLYIFFNIFSVVFVFVRSYTMMVSGTQQSLIVHRSMIKSLLYASLSNFYNRIPVGRIVNRLTKDLRELDQAIIDTISYVLISGFQMLSTLFICIYASSPFAILPMLLVGFLSQRVRKYYIKTQREVARFQKSTNSPVVSGFMSTISGLTTIRAYSKQEDFINLQFTLADQNKKVRLNKSALQNWFALHLAYLSLLINMPCIAFCMFNNSSNPSLIGLLMVYALSLSDQIIGNILSVTDFETKLVSLERIYTFMHIEPQKDYSDYCYNWSSEEEGYNTDAITKGNMEIRDLYVRYRSDLPNVIRGINCNIYAGQKIGIVGRTGAGKTTIINTLLRITEISQGSIIIDGKPLTEYSLKDLRSSITMIDQEPTLIKSTFRENLDITSKYTDQQLNQILSQCNLLEIITQKGGLSGSVSNSSLSAGQKQLLCICRAFLKHSKIVLIDEATANIDVKNDSIIQRVISEKFKQSTVLTIAHRLSTLKNSDKIMVMDKGTLVEFGAPNELQRRQGGIYAEMIRKNASQFLV